MAKLLVAGLINLETTLKIPRFPLDYNPVNYPFFGVNSSVSGVGYNLAKALTILGDQVTFLSMIGTDGAGKLVLDELAALGISTQDILPRLTQTPQSVILYDESGRRQIHVDLKDIQEQAYPSEVFTARLGDCDLAALCNINFARPFLSQALQMGKTIATDVHSIAKLDDPYDRDFMNYAHILFMSHENLPTAPEEWLKQVIQRYGCAIAAVGLGSQEVLFAVRRDNFMERIPAIVTRPVVNTIGAGDALFSAFLHFYAKDGDPYTAIKKATLFASYKIGATGAADGFLDESGVEKLSKDLA